MGDVPSKVNLLDDEVPIVVFCHHDIYDIVKYKNVAYCYKFCPKFNSSKTNISYFGKNEESIKCCDKAIELSVYCCRIINKCKKELEK